MMTRIGLLIGNCCALGKRLVRDRWALEQPTDLLRAGGLSDLETLILILII